MERRWHDADVARLKEMLAQGRTGSEIAAALGRTRNAVLGFIHRSRSTLGIERSPQTERKVPSVRPAPAATRVVKVRPVPRVRPAEPAVPVLAAQAAALEPPAEPAPAQARLIWDLRPQDCRFVVSGGGLTAMFCAAPRRDGSSMCEEHHRLCYIKPEPIHIQKRRLAKEAAHQSNAIKRPYQHAI